MSQSQVDFWLLQPITEFAMAFHDDDSASGRIEWEGGLLYFLVTRCGDAYQCWHCGDDSSPLSPDEAFAFGEPGPTPWLALPDAVRKSLWTQNRISRP